MPRADTARPIASQKEAIAPLRNRTDEGQQMKEEKTFVKLSYCFYIVQVNLSNIAHLITNLFKFVIKANKGT